MELVKCNSKSLRRKWWETIFSLRFGMLVLYDMKPVI